jgi:hypothetical protein
MTIKTIDWSYYKGPVPGYGACRAVPGEYACLLPDRYVESSFSGFTFQNPIAENVIFIRIPHTPGDGRIVGGGHTSDQTLEWDVNHWAVRGTFYGPNAAIYGAADALVAVSSRADYQVTDGWRYLDVTGTLVDCQSTYADKARGLYEYTAWPDVAIGQGGKPDMGAVVSFPGEKLRRLDPRPVGERTYPFQARFMHSDRDGDNFGIAIVDLGARKTYFIWATLAELRALPFVTDAPTPIPVPPVPVPPKPPTPEPPVMDYLAIITRVRAKYPTPLGARHWEFLVDVAQQTVTQLYRKEDDNSVKIPALGVRVSLDIIGRGTLGNQWADILANSEGTADPVFQLKDTPALGEYVDVSGVALPGQPLPGPAPGPTPTPGPVPSPDVIASILARLDALEGPRAVTIQTNDGTHYLCAEGAGGGEVNATRTAVGGWEVFTIARAK